MGLFSNKVKVDPAELAAMRDELLAVRARLDAADQAKEQLETYVRTLYDTTSALHQRADSAEVLASRLGEVDELRTRVAQIDGVNDKLASVDALSTQLAELSERVTASAEDAKNAVTDAKTAKEQAVTLNERVSNVTTELANQLGELSKELDHLGSRPAAPVLAFDQTATEEMIEELHEAQVRLATEQARYEIAFRQDLANLADQIKRPRP